MLILARLFFNFVKVIIDDGELCPNVIGGELQTITIVNACNFPIVLR